MHDLRHNRYLATAAVLMLCASATAQPQVFVWEGVQPIPDLFPPGVAAEIMVPGDGGPLLIDDLDVDVIVDHTFQGDLVVELLHVNSGTSAVLMNRPGDPEFPNGFPEQRLGDPFSFNEFFFDDEAGAPYDFPFVAFPGIANVSGPWQPDSDPLSGFDGLDATGLWQLKVSDVGFGGNGFIGRFSLHITPPCQPPSIILQPPSQIVCSGDDVTLEVQVQGTGPFMYDWCFEDLCTIFPTDSGVVQLDNIQLNQGGIYSVDVFGACGVVGTGAFEINVTDRCALEPPGCPPAAPNTDCQDQGLDIVDVYPFSGEFYTETIDLRIPGRGLDFVWSRKYRSQVDTGFNRFANQWDFSYDIRLTPQGSSFLIWDGNTRKDHFTQQLDGTWQSDEFFRILEFNQSCTRPENTNCYALTFDDTSQWRFFGFDSPFLFQLESIVDRNGNALLFDYDPGFGSLVKITDTLGREIDIGYNADNNIASITDWAGRQVTYDYYEDGDAGGSAGDLKSVTTPLVIPDPEFTVPPGHEFPSGKTTVYTYTTGFADERLNHNLLTITDPKGQTYLVNEYDGTQDAANPGFDRLVRQTLGGPGDVIDFVYVPQVPDAANNFAVTRAIINDRVGNVAERSYDGLNRMVIDQWFAGRADPDLPTTDGANRPLNPLRPDDPEFFEARYEWNVDSLCTRTVLPNANEILQTFDAANAARRSQGNLVQRCRDPQDLGGDQDMICELFEYDDDFGGCCGTNFVTRHTDGRGNDTIHQYDAAGNRTHTTHRIPSIVEDFEYNTFGQLTRHILPDNGSGSRRNDSYTYYGPGDGTQKGYLKEAIIDDPGFGLTTTYEYDIVGNLTRTIDPRGNDSTRDINQLNQVVREHSAEVPSGSGTRYERITFYDPNDNIIRIDIENRDDAGSVVPANPEFTTTYEYDILNYLTRRTQELEPADDLVTEIEYDANRNTTLTRNGEATNGNDPFNTHSQLYDERDLLFRDIYGEGGPHQSTTQYDYDGNRNVRATRAGLEDTPRVTLNTYDGYDRLIASIDPMGNVTEFHYDPNGNTGGEIDPNGQPGVLNPFGERRSGELVDLEGSADNLRLFETTYAYDSMNRMTRQVTEFFDTASQTPIMGGQQPGQSITDIQYSDNSQVIARTNDNQHTIITQYDTANRPAVVIDPRGNTKSFVYDPNSNPLVEIDLEKSDLLNPDQSFTTTYEYDSINRITRTVDNRGNDRVTGYDSRDNPVIEIDPLDHVTRYAYDGMNRLTHTIHDLDNDGADGDGPDILTIKIWDDSSRLIDELDDLGHGTTYEYDSLNRMTRQTHADGTDHNYSYDVHGNRTAATDANGTTVTSAYDLLDRLTTRTVDRATVAGGDAVDVLGTTLELFAYDGLSRVVSAADDDSLVTLSYDSLSNTLRETRDGLDTIRAHDGVGNTLSCTYPGGRQITSSYDALERKQVISDADGLIARYHYVGPQRTEQIEYGNHTRCDYTYDGITGVADPAGDFGVRQIISTTHSRVIDGAIIDTRSYLRDPLYNKIRQQDLRDPGPQLTHDYVYDSIYRLTRTIVTDGDAATVRDTQVMFDGVGNRQQVTGTPDPGPYFLDDGLPEPGDFQTNQYSTTPFDTRLHDPNGNLTARLAADTLHYDFRNQMVEYLDGTSGQRHTYAYDALGRRISRILDADGAATETRYYYDARHVVEERSGDAAVQATYVYGQSIDAVLNLQRDVDNDAVAEHYFYHGDDLHSVVALTRGSAVADGWADDLDSYPVGVLSGLGGWQAWDNNPAFGDFEINTAQAHSGTQSVAIDGTDDAARLYLGFDSGLAVYSAWQYIPSDFTSGGAGNSDGSYFSLLNTYNDGGPYHGSVQIQFDSNDGLCKVYQGTGLITADVPYETDRWVKIQTIIDLDNDWTRVYYDDDLVTEYPWTGGVLGGGGGVLEIAAVNLFANNSSVIYYDDLSLERFAEGLPGTVVERYAYQDYGAPSRTHCPFDQDGSGTVNAADLAQLLGAWGPNPGHPADLNNDGVVNAADLAQLLGHWGPCEPPPSLGNPLQFTARRYDPESGLYYYRSRYLDPQAGRFTTRDPIGMWRDDVNLGNGYTYVGNNPATRLDPTGLHWERQKGGGIKWLGAKGKQKYGVVKVWVPSGTVPWYWQVTLGGPLSWALGGFYMPDYIPQPLPQSPPVIPTPAIGPSNPAAGADTGGTTQPHGPDGGTADTGDAKENKSTTSSGTQSTPNAPPPPPPSNPITLGQRRTIVASPRGGGVSTPHGSPTGYVPPDNPRPAGLPLGQGKMAGYACLDESCLVVTPAGLRRIGDIRLGDEVLTSAGEFRKVIGKDFGRVWEERLDDYVEITTARGSIILTTDHVIGGKPAGEWRNGTRMSLQDGALLPVAVRPAASKVSGDLRLEDDADYVVNGGFIISSMLSRYAAAQSAAYRNYGSVSGCVAP